MYAYQLQKQTEYKAVKKHRYEPKEKCERVPFEDCEKIHGQRPQQVRCAVLILVCTMTLVTIPDT